MIEPRPAPLPISVIGGANPRGNPARWHDRQYAATLLQALATPALLVDGFGRLLHANREGALVLDRRETLGVGEDGRIGPGCRVAMSGRQLRDFLASIRQRGPHSCASLRLPHRDRRAACLLLATPLRGGNEAADADLLLQLFDPASRSELDTQLLREAFGLTAAEASVASLVCSGMATPRVAGTLRLSVSTVRTHLTRCFEKTGAHSQVALARLLAALPAPGSRTRPPGWPAGSELPRARMAGLVVGAAASVLAGCAPPVRELASVREVFPATQAAAAAEAPQEARKSSIYEVAFADVFRVVNISASQAQLNVEEVRETDGLILATRSAMMDWSGTSIGSISPHRFFYAISVKELAPRRTEVSIAAKVQGKCQKTGAGARALLGASTLGLTEMVFQSQNSQCEKISKPDWALDSHSAEPEMAQFMTFLRNNLLAAGLL